MRAGVGANRFQWLQRLLGLLLLLMLGGCATMHPSTALPAQSQAANDPPRAISLPGQNPGQNTIVVVGDGTMRVQANLAQITFSIEVVDASVLSAHRVAGDTMQSVLNTIATFGIDAADFRPHGYNVWAERYYPGYVREDPGTVPLFPDPNEETLFRVIHQVYVLVRDREHVAEVVDAMAAAGGEYFYLYGIDHLYDDPASLEHESRAKAVADAQRKAEEIARRIGVELGPVISMSELVQGAYLPQNFPLSLWPGEQQFYKQLQVAYAFTESATATPPTVTPSTVTPTTTIPITPTMTTGTALDNGEVTITGGDEHSLREFLRHFFIQTFEPIQPSNTDVYVNSLPPDLPFALQLSPALTVVGSIVTTGEYANSQILFTVNGDASEQLNDLRGQLERQGYTVPRVEGRGVFVTDPAGYIALCSEDSTLMVNLSARNLGNDSGVLRIYTSVVTAFGGACGQSGDPSANRFDPLLPTLIAPVPIGVYSSSGSGEDRGYETTIRFVAETSVADLAEHYLAQLTTHGWEQLGVSQTADMVWSGWSFSADDQRYTALFTVMRIPSDQDRFQTTLRIELTP